MKNIQILKLNTKEDFKKVPKSYKKFLNQCHIGQTLIIIGSNSTPTLTSKDVRKILDKNIIDNPSKFILLTWHLSSDAEILLQKKGIGIITLCNAIGSYPSDELINYLKGI